VADAIEDHYKPRFAGDALPRGEVGIVVALADKLETLAGLFGIGQLPTGDKDPFALRRHALGVIRMLVERALPLEVPALVARPSAPSPKAMARRRPRWRTSCTTGWSAGCASGLQRAGSRRRGGAAPAALGRDPGAAGGGARLRRAARGGGAGGRQQARGQHPEEVRGRCRRRRSRAAARTRRAALAAALAELAPRADAAFDRGDHAASLQVLSALKSPVDAFFDAVMVNADDPALRANRLALLAALQRAMNRVADLSRLAA
jgi:glycyl-tRNA synthetase beta chain